MRYRFDQFELDLTTQELRRGDELVPLWPKVFDFLRYLVEHPGRVLTKRELLDKVWSDAHVNEGTVAWTASQARRALGQAGGQKQPIETVHKRGYRFIAEVEAVHAPPPVSVNEPSRRPFVGREAEMALLKTRLREARDVGRGSLTLLVGPLGIGKTRCMDELADFAARAGVDLWPARCIEAAGAPVFWPWTIVLGKAAHARRSLSARANALLDRLNDGVDAPSSIFEWLEGVSSLLADAASERPILISIDDVQWADTATLELLAFIAPELRRLPIVFIATLRVESPSVRSGSVAPAFRTLVRHAHWHVLEPLSAGDIEQYLRMSTGTNALGADVSEAMLRATAGIPLFVEHTLRALLASGQGKAVLRPERIEPAQIARDVFRAMLDQLPADTQELVISASVLGESFGLSELQGLSGLGPDELLARLEPALRSGVVVAVDPSTARFCHALMCTIAYDGLPALTRAGLHRRAAMAIEALDSERWGAIAHHYHRSLSLGEHGRAAAAAERAAHAAARMHAFADASRFSGWAIEAQAFGGPRPPGARAELLLFHAQMLMNAAYDVAAREIITMVAAIAREHSMYELLVEAARILRRYPLMGGLDDPFTRDLLEEALEHAPAGANSTRIGALSQLSWTPPFSQDIARSKAMSAEALRLAHEFDDESLLLHAFCARLHALSGPDDCEALLSVASELQGFDPRTYPWLATSLLGARHAAHLHRGNALEADAALDELGRLARAHHWTASIWIHDRLRLQEQILRGELVEAVAALDALRAYAERFRVPFGAEMQPVLEALLTVEKVGVRALKERSDLDLLRGGLSLAPIGLRPTIARVLFELGERSFAKAMLDELGSSDFASVPRDIGYLGALASLGMLSVQLNMCAHAQRLYALLAPYPHHNALNLLSLHEGSVSYFLALLADFLEKPDTAVEHHFEDAVSMNERSGLRPQLARTYCEYGRWLRARGAAERANLLFARARSLAESCGMEALVARLPQA